MISAVILAAGSSSRMGVPKALLEIGGKTFLRHIVDILASASVLDVTIVLGSDAERIRGSLSWFGGTIVVNPAWHEGQLSSVISGIDAAVRNGSSEGILLCPVDHPLISHGLIAELLGAFRRSKKKIVIPVYRGRRGHPVIFAATLLEDLRYAPSETGARAVVHRYPEEVAEVDTEDEGAVINIDSMADYRRYVEDKKAEGLNPGAPPKETRGKMLERKDEKPGKEDERKD